MTAPPHAAGNAWASDRDREFRRFELSPDGRDTDQSRPEHAHAVVEFPALLSLVAAYASSAPGAARIRSLKPATARDNVADRLALVAGMRWLLAREGGWRPVPVPELHAAIARLALAGASWTGPDLRLAHTLLVSARLARGALVRDLREAEPLVALQRFVPDLVADVPLERELDRVVDDDGVVRDDASPALRRYRRELRGAEANLVRLLEKLIARLEPHHRVDDGSVTLRNGRYVIPLRREGRGVVGGIVHDTSSSGATLFVEPPAAVEAGNRIRELEAEEVREVERVLLEATDRLRPMAGALDAALHALIELDALYGCARYADANDCAPALLNDPADGFVIVNGRHPLLAARDAAGVVAFDLAMDATERTLLVSGPNTGGKTVLLKAVALLSLMAQAGIPATVGVGSRIAVFDQMFADIGDEQSLEASLSTFSAHLRNLTEIVRDATPRSLVLADELGSGTDPVEGAALGGAILEALTQRGSISLATTHLGALKELAHEVPGVVNASLQFDAVHLAPTYRLIKGIPGRSYGLSIARRLGMPDAVLARAELRVPVGERDVAALLEDLERRQAEVTAREQAVQLRHDSVLARENSAHEREVAVRAQERALERDARKDARRYVLGARQEIERVIAELRASGAESVNAAAVDARRKAELLAAQLGESVQQVDSSDPGLSVHEPTVTGGAVVVGARVGVATLAGRAGHVVELRGGDAVVAVGGVKLTVPISSLRVLTAGRDDAPQVRVTLMGDQPDAVARHEIDLRGMRIGELDTALAQALDDAVRADLRTLRIIHGKGTGALRERVSEVLGADGRVLNFRLGLWNEGGAGVTIAALA